MSPMTYIKWQYKDGTFGERITYGEILDGLKVNLEAIGAVIVKEIVR